MKHRQRNTSPIKSPVLSGARKKDGTPTLSVCIPIYNGAAYLQEALDSVLAQDFDDFELLIVDDGSTDQSAAIIARCQDPRLRTHRNEQRLGLVGNWNRCMDLACGCYVTLFHQDDVMQPHNLRRKIELLERNSKVGMVYSDVKIVGPDGSVRMENWPTPIQPNEGRIIPGLEFFVQLITGYNLVCCPTVIARKQCFTQLGGFDARLPFTVDWEMWLRVALHWDVGYLDARLVHYRQHESNETNRFKGASELEEEFRAKSIALEREPRRIPNCQALRRKVCDDLEARALRAASNGQLPPEELKAYQALAAEMHRAGRIGKQPARPARILFVTHEATRTGAPMVLLHILRWLREHTKLEFEILIGCGGPLEAEFAKLAVTHKPDALARNPRSFDRFALIYSNTLCNGLLLDGLPYGDIPIITHLHELDYAFDANGAKDVAAVIKQTNHFFACANIVADRFHHRFRVPRDKFSVHYETIPFESVTAGVAGSSAQLLRQKHDLPENAFIIAGCGTFDIRKAPDLFVQMAACLHRKTGGDRPLRFIWIGKAPDPAFRKALQSDIQRLGLQSEIKFIGEQESPHALLALADVFCLTSREDPFPLVMMEAAALGKPVVCFEEAGGSVEFCALGGGVSVPFLDIEAMAEQCRKWMLDPALRTNLGRRAAELIRTQFDIEAVIPKLWRELETFLREPPSMSKYRLADTSQMDIYSEWLREEITDELKDVFQKIAPTKESCDVTEVRGNKILFVSHEATRTGAPMVLLHILRWLRKNTDVDFEILLGRGGPLEQEFAQLAPIHTPESLARNPGFWQQYRLIYSNTAANGLFLEGMPYGDIPIITHLHELDSSIDHFGAKNAAAVIKQSNHFIACATIVADRFHERFRIPRDKFSVHYETIPVQTVTASALAGSPAALRRKYDIPENAFVLAACGTVEIRKAADLFVQLAARLCREPGLDCPLRFLWIGRSIDRGNSGLAHILKHDIRRLGLQNEIKFVGELASPHSLLALADVFCLTSREDPFPLVMMEAAALGKPVVCMDGLGGGAEFCAMGGGISVPFLDLEAMAQQCRQLMLQPAMRAELGQRAAELVRTRFDIDVIVPNLWRELEAFLRQPPAMSKYRLANSSLMEIFSEWPIDGVPDGLYKTLCQARELVAAGRRDEAIQALTKGVEAAAETRDPEFLLESLVEISRELVPIDPKRAEFLLRKAEILARELGKHDRVKTVHALLNPSTAHTGARRVGFLSFEPHDRACPFLRLKSPLEHLERQGLLEQVSLGSIVGDQFQLAQADLKRCDVVVVQRQMASVLPYPELRKKLDGHPAKIVFEMDDALTELPEWHRAAKAFRKIQPRIEEYLRRADLVTVSTPQLRELYASFNRNIAVLPNSVDLAVWPPLSASPEPSGKITILFSGTLDHERDLQVAEPALLDLIAAYPDQVELLYWGNITERLRALPQVKAGPEFTPNYHDYAALLQKLPVSFAIAPLEDIPFNRAKSPIKWLEYSMCRIPGIYSALPPYNQAVEQERTGLLVANTSEAWFSAMKMLVDNPALRHQLAEHAQQSVLAGHTLEQNARAWLQAYESLFAHATVQADAIDAPNVSIVIPVFNQLELTRQCLAALKKNTRLAGCEIIVVDNGSADATPGFLKSEEAAGQLRLVRNAKNLGFAKACNQGASIARGHYVLFLNNDTEVQPGWLEPLLSVAENDPSVAAVGSKLLYPDGTIQHAGVALADIAGRDPLMAMHTFSRDAADLPAANLTRVYQALTAACLLIRKSAFEAVTGFDEGFWNGYEDVDLCLRLQEHGGLIVYEPASVVVHHESQSGPARFEKVQDNIRRLHQKWLGKAKVDVAISADETVTFLETSPIRPYRVSPASQPLVSIIILAHNQLDHTRRCLESIEHHTPEPHELILVDNGSSDGTPGYFRDYAGRHQHVTVIANLSNRGFAAGNNQGIAAARGEFILLLNNDTVVTAAWLKKMLDVLQLQPDIGIVGPRSNRVLGNQQVDAPAYETLEELPAFAAQWARTNAGQSRVANRVMGFCLLTKRAVIDRIGGLDEQFGSGNFEDDDFCIRAGLAGFETRIADETFVHHVGNATFNGARIDYRQAMLANWGLFKAKWAIPADVPPQVGYQTPRLLPDGVSLNFPIPSLQTSHTLDAGGRFWTEKPRAATTARSPKPKSQHLLPDCARIGELGDAREKLRQKQLQEAWQLTVEAIEQRPFHPEAAMLLAEIAFAAGDGASARQCAQHAHDLAPGWSRPKQWLQKSHKANTRPEWLKVPSTLNSHRSTHLTVCLIARNEEKFLEQCLGSIKDIAAQIILVDTGSTDRTVDIAKANGAEVCSFTWCDDFAAARNAALEGARGDWILILDADEQLPADQHPKLQSDLRNGKALAYRMPLLNLGLDGEGVNYVPRLFRNVPGAFFRGRIHEQIFPSLIALSKDWEMETGFGTARLLHHGYEKEVLRDRNKIERNLLLLRRAVEESPDDANLAMNLGLELVRSGDTANGINHYREAFRLMSAQAPGAVVPELREVLLGQFTTHLYKQREHAEVVRMLTSPLAKNGGLTASLHFAVGLSSFELKQYLDAAAHLRRCLDKRNETTFSPASTDIHTSAPYHCLALSLWKLGDAAGAEKAFEAALKEPGRELDVKLDLARFLLEQGRPVDALHRLHEIVAADSRHLASWRLGGEIALSQPGFAEFANDWTGEASQAVPDDLVIAAQRAEVLMLRQETGAARPLWKKACNGARPPRALAAWILCSTVEAKEIPSTKDPEEEAATSRAFVQWYQRLIAFGATETLHRVNTNLDAFRESLPTAAQLLNCALSEASEPAAAGRAP